MKYHNLFIDCGNDWKMYHAISALLEVEPTQFPASEFRGDTAGTWTYQVVTRDEDPILTFINVFLDLLHKKYDLLEALDIQKSDILIWLVYEYEEQCSLSFSPQEMKRLGQSGITFNIDCIQIKKE